MSEKVYKLNSPIKQDNILYYPLTTYDQIIMPSGGRWDGVVASGSGNIKYNTDVNWEDTNPILASGEIIIVKCSDEIHRLKVGDGLTDYKNLSFVGTTVDNALDEESINPVQNKVVSLALNNKIDKSSITNVVEENNNNLVTSAAVYTAIRAYINEAILGGAW